jgi:signal transduction histidine kinase
MAHLALLIAPPGRPGDTPGAIKTAVASMTPKGLILFLGATLVALPGSSWGQKPSSWPVNVRVFRMADGLAESACFSVSLAPQGRILARHIKSSSISQLDGYTITNIPGPAAGNSRVYGSPGGQLWTVVAEGLREFRYDNWLLHPVPEIAAELSAHVPRVIDPVPLCPVRHGVVLFLLPDRLFEFNTEASDHPHVEVLLTATHTRLERFSALALARDGGLWIAGARGLAKVVGPVRNLRRDSECHDFVPPASLQITNLLEPHEDDEGIVTAVAESVTDRQKILAHFDGQNWTAEVVPLERPRYAWRGPDKTDWASTIDSLCAWEPGGREAIESEERTAGQYYDVAVEPGGGFWLASSDGLYHYAPFTWRIPSSARTMTSPIHGLTGDDAGRLWFTSGSNLQLLQNENRREFPLPSATTGSLPPVRTLFRLKNGTLLLEAGDQCLQFNPATAAFTAVRANPPAASLKPLGLLRDGRLCLQPLGAGTAAQIFRLETYDGARFEPLALPPPEPPPGTFLSALLAAQNGDLWVSGDRGTAWYHDQKWRTFASTDGSTPESVVAFAEFADGRIWCATPDKVWAFDGRNWSAMRGGLDRINALMAARDGSLWVGTDSGLYRFFQGAWVENGTDEGLPGGGIRHLYEDVRGRIWAGTAHGISLYHPEADTDPPRTYVQILGGDEKRIPEGSTITVVFSGQDRWNYTIRRRLLYSYRLGGLDWSPFQEDRTFSFADLPAGKYDLQVRAMDRNCNIDPNPPHFDFAIVLPWYKESRLLGIALAGLAVALFFAGLAFNRHRQLLRSYAEVEQIVAQRTQELEVANHQLLHGQKMNALGTLAAGIAHDFNNILSIIKGSAQIIEDNLNNPAKVSTRVDRINTVVEQGAGIVKAMLGFSRDSTDQPGPCDLNAVLDDTVKLLGDRFLREVHVSLERSPALPEVRCSKDFIQQILLNFIFNAAESMTGRKHIVLATRLMDQLPATLVLAPASAARCVAVSVRDFGCGISPENLPRIFEPFFTTKALSTRRGTGLGLSMVYELARKMDAGLAVESLLDHGSTFTLILPVRDPNVPSQA